MAVRRRWVVWPAMLASAAALMAAGCGDDNNSAGESGSETQSAGQTQAAAAGGDTGAAVRGSGTLEAVTGLGAETGAAHDAAVTAGEAAAEAAGGKVALPQSKTIGFLQIVGGIESADRVANATKAALSKVGYRMVLCDGRGDPTKWVACGNSLIDQGVDGIITTGVDPPAVAGPLKKAKAQGIPWISVAGETSPGYDGTYGPDDRHTGRVLADYLIKRLDTVDNPEIAIHDFPIESITVRTEELKKKLAADAKIKVAAETTTDGANLIEGTRKTVTDQLTENPGLNAFWFAFDTAGQVGGQAVSARFAGKSFPDRPLVLTFHADPATQTLLRSGQVDAVCEIAYDIGAWVGVDQLLEFYARDKKPSSDPRPKYPGVGDMYTTQIVTKDNLPPEGKYVAPETDVVSFFEAKWKSEFGA